MRINKKITETSCSSFILFLSIKRLWIKNEHWVFWNYKNERLAFQWCNKFCCFENRDFWERCILSRKGFFSIVWSFDVILLNCEDRQFVNRGDFAEILPDPEACNLNYFFIENNFYFWSRLCFGFKTENISIAWLKDFSAFWGFPFWRWMLFSG